MKKTPLGYFGSQTAIACLALGVALHVTALPGLAAPGGNKGKPGGGGGEDPPSAPVEYQLTWIDGVSVRDCNTAGNAVGVYTDETGARRLFWRTVDGVIHSLDNFWTLPPGYDGWRVGGRLAGMRVNNDNRVCGVLRNEQTSEEQLFTANLLDPDSLKVFGPKEVEFPIPMNFVFMNEHGDVTWWSLVEGNITTLHLYVRSLAKGYDLTLMSVNDAGDLPTTGISLVIAALVGADLHIRIFDADGNQVIDKPEAELANGQELSDLKDFLEGIPFPDEPTMSSEEVTTIIEEAASVSGHPLDKVFSWESDAYDYWPTGINDNLQISLIYRIINGDYYLNPVYPGSGLLTFNVEAPNASYVDDLGDYASSYEDPQVLAWGGLNNAGDVFGCFETEASRIRYRGAYHRVADTTAGFIAAGSTTWSELDPRLPVGGEQSGRIGYIPAACALDVNEAGQVLGGYQGGWNSQGLWLLDPDDGLFDVDDLVVGDPTEVAEVEAFRAATNFSLVRITEPIDSGTGYGIITGSMSFFDGPAFILTPRLVEQP